MITSGWKWYYVYIKNNVLKKKGIIFYSSVQALVNLIRSVHGTFNLGTPGLQKGIQQGIGGLNKLNWVHAFHGQLNILNFTLPPKFSHEPKLGELQANCCFQKYSVSSSFWDFLLQVGGHEGHLLWITTTSKSSISLFTCMRRHKFDWVQVERIQLYLEGLSFEEMLSFQCWEEQL